jgi:anionic cell wall polymer biosynthesis LytR-Cps2A-Psr (LCP) family protein
MDGGRALLYVRDDTGWTTGERARRQQNALRSIMDKAVSSNILTDPVRFYDFLDAVSRFMSVDETLSNGEMRVVALQLSGLRPENVLFLRAPVGALIQDRGAPTVQLDAARSAALWSAVAQGTAEVYVQQNGRDALGPVTR